MAVLLIQTSGKHQRIADGSSLLVARQALDAHPGVDRSPHGDIEHELVLRSRLTTALLPAVFHFFALREQSY